MMMKKKSQLTKTEKLDLAKSQHYKWLRSLGLSVDDDGHILKSYYSNEDDLNLDHLKVRDSIPTSDRIVGDTYRRYYSTNLPAGKTISVAYNKGAYQVVDAKDIKTMGRKI